MVTFTLTREEAQRIADQINESSNAHLKFFNAKGSILAGRCRKCNHWIADTSQSFLDRFRALFGWW